MAELELLSKIKEGLENDRPVRALEFTDEEAKQVKNLHLLTQKPMLYVANVAEDELGNLEQNEYLKSIEAYAEKEGSEVIVISAKVEEEIAVLDEDEKEMLSEARARLAAGPAGSWRDRRAASHARGAWPSGPPLRQGE